MSWLRTRRIRRVLATPFPDAWRDHLAANVKHAGYLEPESHAHLRTLVQLFIADKHWEGVGGMQLDDEVRVTIAGQACLLLLGLEPSPPRRFPYRNVQSILVYPSTVLPKRVETRVFEAPSIVPPIEPLLGEAHGHGPVILTWDAVKRGGIHPELGHNVVYHEFAHKLDMLDGDVDGTPPLPSRAAHARWVEVCTREHDALRTAVERGEPTFLDPYASTTPGEFFAVATECFFDQPVEMRRRHPELYAVLQGFYRQDPAARALRAGDVSPPG